MDDAKRSETVHTRIPRPTRGWVPPYFISTPVARIAGSKRRLQVPECPINAKNPKLADNINDWLSVLRKKVDEEQKTNSFSERSHPPSEGSQFNADRVSCLDHQNDNFRRRFKNRRLKSRTARRRQQSNVYQITECSSPNTTNSPVTGSYSQPSQSYYDQCLDETYQGYNLNEQGPDGIFVFSASYQSPNSACYEPQGRTTIKLKDEVDSPEPIDLVASETFMYVLSDDEESSPKKRKKRSRKRRSKGRSKLNNEEKSRHSLEEEKDDVFYSEPTSQPETDSEISEPQGPVATKTHMSVLSDHKKPRKRRRKCSKKKRKAQSSHINQEVPPQDNQEVTPQDNQEVTSQDKQEVTSQDNDLARNATERFRLAQINVLQFRLSELTLENYKPDRTSEVKRKREPVCREDVSTSDVESLNVKISKIFIGERTIENSKPGRAYHVKRKHEPVCREDMSTCDVDVLDVEIRKLCIGELTLDSYKPDKIYGVKHTLEPDCREDMSACDVDSLDVKIRNLSID